MSDLNSMSLKDLQSLQKEIGKAIETYEARKLDDARSVLEAKARELGVSLEAVLGGKSKKPVSKVAPKYCHPENPEQTWTGRGRAPNWVLAHEAQGGSREDLLIG